MGYNKTFIGSGKSTQYGDVKITIKMNDDISNAIYQGKQADYLQFILKKSKNVDKFGNDYQAFYTRKDNTTETSQQQTQQKTTTSTTPTTFSYLQNDDDDNIPF